MCLSEWVGSVFNATSAAVQSALASSPASPLPIISKESSSSSRWYLKSISSRRDGAEEMMAKLHGSLTRA